MAGPRPLFQAPFPCDQTWDTSTYDGHWPNQNSIDIARRDGDGKNISKGEPVLASADGIVTDVFATADGENRVYVDHGGGWVTHYIHHEQTPSVAVGQFVAQGEKIGETSNTGAKAVHIHYSQLRDNEAVRITFNGQAIDTHAGNNDSYGTWGSDDAEEITSKNCPRTGGRYIGVFRRGSGPYALWLTDQRQGFISKWQELSAQDLRLVDLHVAEYGDQRRYSGAFAEGTGGHALWLDASRQGFINKWKELAQEDLRLTDLEIYGAGSNKRYAGVFESGTDAYALWLDSSRSSLIDKWKDLSSRGLRLIDLSISVNGNTRRYSGVFRQGSGGHALWLEATWTGFVAKWKELSSDGLRLIDLEATGKGRGRRYSGVFRQGSGGYGLWQDDYSGFVNRWMEWSGQGLRLVDIETS